MNLCVFKVSSIKPVVSQAEITRLEMESCLNLEYTPESLPLLLHQVCHLKLPSCGDKIVILIHVFLLLFSFLQIKLINWHSANISWCSDGEDLDVIPLSLRNCFLIIRSSSNASAILEWKCNINSGPKKVFGDVLNFLKCQHVVALDEKLSKCLQTNHMCFFNLFWMKG